MIGGLLMLSWLAPLALLPLAVGSAGRWWPALAVLPALAAAVLVPEGTVLDVSWLLLGTHLGLDPTGRMFLLFSALVWLFAGLYAAVTQTSDARAGRFRLFFLLAMAGNLLLVLAADMMTFYFGFALMGLSAYALVVHRRSQRARRAGRLYLAWTLVGEVALFSAVLLLASEGNESLRFAELAQRDLPAVAVGLVIFGFGVKLALPGLHVWLPLAYPAAPAPAAAVLSGPMINAGLLGWLRFLPPEAGVPAHWGGILVAAGVVGIALGVLAGLAQRDPRAVLAYSSIAKTGLVSVVFGIALGRPEQAALITGALVLFAMHHLLVKGTMFLGIGEWERNGCSPWVLAGLAGLALAMMGIPFTAGAVAKSGIEEALASAGVDLKLLLFFSALGTALLMVRFLWLVAGRKPDVTAGSRWSIRVWLALVSLALWLPFAPAELTGSPAGLLPVAAALSLAWVARRLGVRGAWFRVPPGDVLGLLPGFTSWRPAGRLGDGARWSLALVRRPVLREGRAPSLTSVGWGWLLLILGLLSALIWPG